jgi:hypothetical protein
MCSVQKKNRNTVSEEDFDHPLNNATLLATGTTKLQRKRRRWCANAWQTKALTTTLFACGCGFLLIYLLKQHNMQQQQQQQPTSRRLVLALLSCVILACFAFSRNSDAAQALSLLQHARSYLASSSPTSSLSSPLHPQPPFHKQSLPAAAAADQAAAVGLPRARSQVEQQQHDSEIRVWIPPFFALIASVRPRLRSLHWHSLFSGCPGRYEHGRGRDLHDALDLRWAIWPLGRRLHLSKSGELCFLPFCCPAL